MPALQTKTLGAGVCSRLEHARSATASAMSRDRNRWAGSKPSQGRPIEVRMGLALTGLSAAAKAQLRWRRWRAGWKSDRCRGTGTQQLYGWRVGDEEFDEKPVPKLMLRLVVSLNFR